MDIISYEYTKQRKDYGKHVQFNDSAPCCTSVNSITNSNSNTSDTDEITSQWILPNITTIELQCIPDMSIHDVNTERYITHNKSVLHVDGGWPIDVKSNDSVDKQRYIRRLVLESQYSTSIIALCKSMDTIINSNNTIDLYEQYYTRNNNGATNNNIQSTDIINTQTNLQTVAVFRDPLQSNKQRSATSISWYPDTVENGGAKLAVSYSTLVFQQNNNNNPSQAQPHHNTVSNENSYLWNTGIPNSPDTIIQSSTALTCMKYNPRSPDHLLVGHYNGCVSFYDLRKSNHALESSILELSHNDAVYDLAWVQSRSGNECVSISTDGDLLWWDIRKLRSGPIDRMILKDDVNSGFVYGARSLEYKSDAGATRYLIGTEQGIVVLCDRKAKKDSDSQKSIKTIYGQTVSGGAHYGPIYSIQRNPFNLKYFLTCGDWCTKIWFDDIKTPLITTMYGTAYLTAACWSITRPGVYYTGSCDGTLCIWDLYMKQHEPVYVTKINTDIQITALVMKSDGWQLGVSSADGSVTVVRLSKNLVELQANEKSVISQLFENETKREKTLELRLVQRKRDAKDNEKQKIVKSDVNGTIDLDSDEYAELISQADTEFLTILQQQQNGIINDTNPIQSNQPVNEKELYAEEEKQQI